MTNWVRQVLERYGQEVTVRTGGEAETTRAFVQPAAEQGEEAPADPTPLGWTDGRLWLYLGQAAVEEGDTISWNGLNFRVRSCRPYYIGEALSHYWAALEKEREAAV